jgi:hypothetical protein
MALLNRQEVEFFIRAVMDPDSLRVVQHLIQERIDTLKQENPVHQRPFVLTAGENTQGPEAASRQSLARAPAESPLSAPQSNKGVGQTGRTGAAGSGGKTGALTGPAPGR